MLSVRSTQASRNVVILAVCLLTVLVFGPTLKTIISLGLHDDRYLQIVVAPLACGLLLFFERMRIFPLATYSSQTAVPWLSMSVLVGTFFVYVHPAGESAGRVLAVCAMVLVWMATFVLCFGIDTFRAALYPLSCLLLMVPFPSSWMNEIAIFLQHGSAATAYRVLRMTGIPVLRHGMVFSLPGLDFEVAAECSGIHSSLALLMIAIVAGYLRLRSGWARAAMIVLTIPIALLKNAIRIVVITVLGARVDRAFIDGPFHHRYGGLVFSVIAVVPFVLVLAGLQAVESWRPGRRFNRGDRPGRGLARC